VKSPEAGGLWLRLDPQGLSKKESLEYSIKRPLFAASAVFTLERDADYSNVYTCRSFIKGKIPFRGSWEMRSESRIDTQSPGKIGFVSYSESPAGKPVRQWRAGKELELFEGASKDVIQSVELASVEIESAVIQNAVQLLFAFASTWQPKAVGFFGQFVVGNQLMALRTLRRQKNVFDIFLLEIQSALSLEQVKQLDWHSAKAHRAAFTWDPDRKVISSLEFKLPWLGELEIPLTRHSRE
jgi:hypothetical protein